MGNQFAKTWQYMFITANQIAYPDKQPANQPIKKPLHSQQPQQKNIFNFKSKLVDSLGWLPVEIDFNKFKLRPFYKQVDDIQLDKHLKALQQKQQLLKQFKYSQDFDRIDYGTQNTFANFQMDVQKIVVGHFVLAAFVSRLMVITQYNHQYSYALWRKFFTKFYFKSIPIAIMSLFFSQQASPINHQYFRSNQNGKRVYQTFAYDLNMYQNVNDIKYNFKYPSTQEYNQTISNVKYKINEYKYEDSIKYFKKFYGIVSSEKYLNQNRSVQIQK